MATTTQPQGALTTNRLATGRIVSGIATMLTLGVAFGLLALGVGFFWVAFPVSFGGVLPVMLGAVALVTTAD
ncbi:hypothetical protein [Halorientalis sp.]|uniref:hypothetical protein n=1 Tax=Halorientalis sp. TaxID=1931229 RepID=UPI00263720EF|nr:hypothetical protein [Halorientalis sp.]